MLQALGAAVADSFRGLLGDASADTFSPNLLRDEPLDKVQFARGFGVAACSNACSYISVAYVFPSCAAPKCIWHAAVRNVPVTALLDATGASGAEGGAQHPRLVSLYFGSSSETLSCVNERGREDDGHHAGQHVWPCGHARPQRCVFGCCRVLYDMCPLNQWVLSHSASLPL